LESVGKSAGVFNPEKFLWLNSHYLKTRPLEQLSEEIVPYMQARGYVVPTDKTWLQKMIRTLRERAKTLVEIVDAANFYLKDDIVLDEKATKKFLTPEIAAPLKSLIQKLTALEDFSEVGIQREFAAVLEDYKLDMGKLAQPVRVALTGSTVSPGIHDVIAVLGKERTLRRLRAALESLN
jgi:glutamyl-tRNA synthetase